LSNIITDKIKFKIMIYCKEETIESLEKKKEIKFIWFFIQKNIYILDFFFFFTNRILCSIDWLICVDIFSSLIPIIKYYSIIYFIGEKKNVVIACFHKQSSNHHHYRYKNAQDTHINVEETKRERIWKERKEKVTSNVVFATAFPLSCYFILHNAPPYTHIYKWIATFWYDWCKKMTVGPNNFWVLHFIKLHACITHQKFPDTLVYIKRDTRRIVNFVLNSMIKYALYSEKLESFNQYYKGTSSRDLLTALFWAELYLKIIFLNDSDWNICRKSSLHFFRKNVTLHFSVLCKFLLKGRRSEAENFTTSRTFCFIQVLKIWA
jgi:hypothetical protein